MQNIFKFSLNNFFLITCIRICFLIFFINCANDIQRPPIYSLLFAGSGSERVGIISTDFASGGRFSVLNSDLQYSVPNFVNVHSDAVLRYKNNKVYIINRLNRDNIQVLNPNFGFLTELEFGTGKGTNPQDIQILNESKAYISLYNSRNLLVVNPGNGFIINSIDLSSFSETSSTGSGGIDGLPEMAQMFLYNGKLFLQLQRLDKNDVSGFPAPNTHSLLLEIDTSTDKVINAHKTPVPNPVSKIYSINLLGDDYLVMSLAGRLGFISKIDGGIFLFNLRTGQFNNTPILSEAAVGGDILDFVLKSESEGYAFSLDSSFNKYIWKFNPITKEKSTLVAFYPSSLGNISGLALSKTGKLYIGDSNFETPGVSIYDTNGTEPRKLNISPINIGLRPFDMVVLED
ncbi:MAG: hypothetical protein KDK36_06125, partial [Leptospiraceae bacterium]|nr:hypothetical protein [Leptospiraceae bacterium]